MTPAFNVLFLCTHNSARSIMAEAIVQKHGGGRFHAYSAGSQPIAEPHAEVMEKLRALGHDIAGLHSKSWDEFTGPNAPQHGFRHRALRHARTAGAVPISAAWR